jgi:anti-anti-sigma factor
MLAIDSGCDLDVERGPNWLLIRVRNFDPEAPGDPTLAERIWNLMQQHFTERLVLELDQVTLLTSQLIGQLIHLYRRISAHEGIMRLCGLSPYNRTVLHQCRLDDRLPIYSDRQEAVLGSMLPRQPR